MDIPKVLRQIQRQLFSAEYKVAQKRQRFLLDIVATDSFSRMTLQDKILSLAKLITVYRSNYHTEPKKLENILLHFNQDLSRQLSSK